MYYILPNLKTLYDLYVCGECEYEYRQKPARLESKDQLVQDASISLNARRNAPPSTGFSHQVASLSFSSSFLYQFLMHSQALGIPYRICCC